MQMLTVSPPSPAPAAVAPVVVVGKESVGKSSLIAGLTGQLPLSSNFRGTTVSVESYEGDDRTFVDTPGIYRDSDSETTWLALAALDQDADIALVVQGTHIDDDLCELLPLVAGRRGIVVATHWDKVATGSRPHEALERLSARLGVPVVPVDARYLPDEQRSAVTQGLAEASVFPASPPAFRVGWNIEPRRTWIDHRIGGPLLAGGLLLAPAILTVWFANAFAGIVDPLVQDALGPLVQSIEDWPTPLSDVLIGDYGLVTMGPLLLVWAAPTVFLYAIFLALYKTSGLLDRISVALFPIMRPVGLTGRDVTRVVMGFGCNVPAVISTRACAGCSRDSTIHAIAFGSACSYQFGATLAVFAAAGRGWLVWPYLGWLTLTTLAYTLMTSNAQARSALNLLMVEGRSFLTVPGVRAVWREARVAIGQFFRTALPIFFVITLVASLLAWAGVVERLSSVLGPLMSAFGLPSDAAIPVLLASIRKDGILLFDEPGLLEQLSSLELLVGVYLAGVLLPCVVTAITVGRERSASFVLRLVGRQVIAAVVFAVTLAWVGTALIWLF